MGSGWENTSSGDVVSPAGTTRSVASAGQGRVVEEKRDEVVSEKNNNGGEGEEKRRDTTGCSLEDWETDEEDPLPLLRGEEVWKKKKKK